MSDAKERKGNISVETADILPIIKKWLYSEHDIFLRELVSNACDALSKLKIIAANQNLTCQDPLITVTVDSEKKTLTIEDTGLGMTEEEVEKYLARLAFSGAKDFIEKMKDQGTELKEDIIGKFGLGFYSAFMVADKVTVETLSYQENASAVHWSCDGSTEYHFRPSERDNVGTKITLWINEESQDFLQEYTLNNTLEKYCRFMPHPIQVGEKVINEKKPLWCQSPSSLKDEDYQEFYKTLFPFEPEPLFWIHLNIDHPFELQGILYFPKIKAGKPVQEKNISLYCKQVYVSDDVKHIVPEFLGLLKGVIDSPDIPLNVSRSALQGDPNIQKISNYIVKKIADTLKTIFRKRRDDYENAWSDISLFTKYGVISDQKFAEAIKEQLIFKETSGKYLTLGEYSEQIPETLQDKFKDHIIYYEAQRSDENLKQHFIAEKMPLLELDSYIDPHLMQHLEIPGGGEDNASKRTFIALDSAYEKMTQDVEIPRAKEISDFFTNHLKKENETIAIETKGMGTQASAAYVKVDESSKRMQQMSVMMGQDPQQFPLKKTLVINAQHPLVQNVFQLWDKKVNPEMAQSICQQIYDLALLSSGGLENEEAKHSFVKRSHQFLQEMSAKAVLE